MRNLSLVDLRRELQNPPDLLRVLWQLVRQIPSHRVSTYGRLAEALGDARATRWVGNVLLNHQHADSCACHRVVRVTGEIGNFVTGDPSEKARQLQSEGVAVNGTRVDMTTHVFTGFRSVRPLAELQQIQAAVLEYGSTCDYRQPRTAAGVDVSYAGDMGFATYAEVESQTGQIAWSHTLSQPIRFPYIPSYLAFRELPLLLALAKEVQQLRDLADVLIVDGSGIAHPRGAGIATMLGIVQGIPTIGITKKSLFGTVDLAGLEFPSEPRSMKVRSGLATLRCLPRIARNQSSSPPVFVCPWHGQRNSYVHFLGDIACRIRSIGQIA